METQTISWLKNLEEIAKKAELDNDFIPHLLSYCSSARMLREILEKDYKVSEDNQL
jgi:hypothetical protein